MDRSFVFLFNTVEEDQIKQELNDPLQRYIAVRGCRELITKVPFFKDCDPNFISQVVVILQLEHFIPGDYIIEEETAGDKMYFIASGSVEASIREVVKARITTGQFFGEIALLCGPTKRTASIRALTHCLLYSLSKKHLDLILKGSTEMRERLKQLAEERLKKSHTPAIGKLRAPVQAAARSELLKEESVEVQFPQSPPYCEEATSKTSDSGIPLEV